jgi:hypothetical protein
MKPCFSRDSADYIHRHSESGGVNILTLCPQLAVGIFAPRRRACRSATSRCSCELNFRRSSETARQDGSGRTGLRGTACGSVTSHDRELLGSVDGKLVIERSDVVFRSTNLPKLCNQFMMLHYVHDGVSHDQTLWIDELAVGTKPIGATLRPGRRSGKQ